MIPWPNPDWHAGHPHPSPTDATCWGGLLCECCYVDQRIAAWTVAFRRYQQ